MLIYFYIIMIKFLLKFAQIILERTRLSFCVPYSFFPQRLRSILVTVISTLLNGVYKAELWSARRSLGRGSATFFLKRCVFLCIQLTN